MIKTHKNSIIIAACTIILVSVGVVMVYSASKYSADVNYGNKYFYMTKQLIGAVLGLAAMIGTSLINHKLYKKLSVLAKKYEYFGDNLTTLNLKKEKDGKF